MENSDNSLTHSLVIQGAIAAMPGIVNMYPHIDKLIEMIESALDSYLGNDEKMIVLTKRNGKTLMVVLDATKEFKLSNELKLEANKENPTLSVFEKNEYKQKLLNSIVLQTLKDKYERLTPEEKANTNNPLSSILKNIPL